MPQAPHLLLVALALLAPIGPALAQAAPSDEVVCPRLTAAPRVDGSLDEPCWRGPAAIPGFCTPGQFSGSPKAVALRCGFDDQALYLAFTCQEPRLERVKAVAPDGSRSVWHDDCIEVLIRTSESVLDYDQFIVNSAGARQAERSRAGRAASTYAPQWQAAARKGAGEWTVEIAIPFATLAMPAPTPGSMVQLALGREDYASGQGVLTNWPAGAAYGATGGYGRLYFATANQLRNPDLSENQDSAPVAWSFGDPKDRSLFASAAEGDRRVIVLQSPDRYATAQQSLRLRPMAWYRLEAFVRGEAAVNLRARVYPKRGDTASIPYDVTCPAGDEYRRFETRFPSGETGDTLIIIGALEGYGTGEVRIAGLRVVQDLNLEAEGPAIPVMADGATVISKALVADCRALRGFVTSPVDGRLNSYDWDVGVWEYGMGGAGAGVGYEHHGNDGLHLVLADQEGVDAVQIRRGAAVKLYAGADRYDSPGKAPLLWTFKGRTESSRALFPKRVRGDRFSFFDRADGLIADVSFLRVGGRLRGQPGPALTAGAHAAWGDLEGIVAGRFPEKQRTVVGLGTGPGQPLAAESRVAYHLLSEPLATETPLDAVGVKLQLAGSPTGCPVTVAIQDPLEPRAELMGVDVAMQGGAAEPLLDFPDQVVPAGKRLWLTVTFGAPVTVEGLQVQLYTLPREAAIPQALAYRKLQFRGLFSQLSEARQWGTVGRNGDVDKFYRENHWGPAIRELAEAIEHAKSLAPDDELVRCYDDWIWRARRGLTPFTPKLDQAAGAPEWAVLLRQAWREQRAIAQWWLDNRLVPTGEFGGLVGDDSDLYQNLADLPMLESDGVGLRAKQGAAALAELAERTTLEGGLNKHTMDPLHAYEEGPNHEALMLWWNYGDPVYFERCLLAAKNLPALTVMTDAGHRHFKNQECGAEDLRTQRPLGEDGDCHPLMWHPALEVAWYNRSPAVLKYLDEWASGWLAHMKPGEYATMVDVKTETVTAKSDRPLYGGYGGQGTAHGFLYQITGDQKYLQPYMDGFTKGEAVWPANRFLPELWHCGYLDGVEDKALQSVLTRNPLTQALAQGNREPLLDALRDDIAEVQRFRPMYTTAEVFTDRVFLDRLERVTTCYTGGFATRNKFNHTHALSWEGFGTDFAAMVLQARPDRLRVLGYSFAGKPVTGKVRFWTLDHGKYRLTLGPDGNRDDEADKLTRDGVLEIGRAAAVSLTLPPGQVTVLELTQVQKLDDLRLRPDLALSAREMKVTGGKVIAVVHNIGGREAAACAVALVDPKGKVRASQKLAPLAAPTDLQPKRSAVTFTAPRGSLRGWKVVVDPGRAVAELYEGNNEVVLR